MSSQMRYPGYLVNTGVLYRNVLMGTWYPDEKEALYIKRPLESFLPSRVYFEQVLISTRLYIKSLIIWITCSYNWPFEGSN
jgi:hypothetical protein